MQQRTICVVGLGYVGLPLLHAFAGAGHACIGYDVSERRVKELQGGHDVTKELTPEQMKAVSIDFSIDPTVIGQADIVIMALPTPVDEKNKPDLRILESASETVGTHMRKGAIVVYESTVYPGTTEEICGPILEKASGFESGVDFFLGYSPERINPGDKEHTVHKIVKIVSGQNPQITDLLVELYGSIVEAGIHRAPSIKVAEMAKAIENAQRDINIAFVNEVAMFCNTIGIPTTDVLKAAGTKWNFLRFSPGLVGGHCIGVDPYYLVEKAQQMGMETHVIAAGRAINDKMAAHVATRVLTALGEQSRGAKILVLGLTFKENVPDDRNSKSFDVVRELTKNGAQVAVHDPYVTDPKRLQGCTSGTLEEGPYDAVVLLVPHREYLSMPLQKLIDAVKDGGAIYDLKSVLDKEKIEEAGRKYVAL